MATVTDAEPGRLFAFDVCAFGTPVARWQYDITPTEDGCEVRESTWERRPPWLRIVGALATATWRRAEANQRNIQVTLRRLKDRAEAAQ